MPASVVELAFSFGTKNETLHASSFAVPGCTTFSTKDPVVFCLNQHAQYLDRAPVECPVGTALSRFQLRRGSDDNCYNEVTCCQVNSKVGTSPNNVPCR